MRKKFYKNMLKNKHQKQNFNQNGSLKPNGRGQTQAAH